MHISGNVEISRSPSLEEQHKTERAEDSAHESKKYRTEQLMLGAAIVYAFLTLLIYCASKKAADAAKSAADTAADQLKDFEATQAAEVVVSFKPNSYLTEGGKNIRVEGSIDFTNTGQTAAKNFRAGASSWTVWVTPANPSRAGPVNSSSTLDRIGPLRLGRDQMQHLPVELQLSEPDAIHRGDIQYGISIDLVYDDLFGQSYSKHECFIVDRKHPLEFMQCPPSQMH